MRLVATLFVLHSIERQNGPGNLHDRGRQPPARALGAISRKPKRVYAGSPPVPRKTIKRVNNCGACLRELLGQRTARSVIHAGEMNGPPTEAIAYLFLLRSSDDHIYCDNTRRDMNSRDRPFSDLSGNFVGKQRPHC
jgi:hypothetical protein